MKDEEGVEYERDDASNKIYVIMELAVHKESMTWNENAYCFNPNKIFGSPFMPVKDILSILLDLAQGLNYLHYVAGIVHRDIKPQNILICNNANSKS